MKPNDKTSSRLRGRGWLARKLAAVALGFGACLSSGVSAALLGVEPGYPVIVYAAGVQTNQTSYNAGTQSFTVTDSDPQVIQFAAGEPGLFINFPKGVEISIVVDNDGNLVGGVPGDDLVVTGTIVGGGPAAPTGVLLTGEIVAFGFQDTGGPLGRSTDFFDFRFIVTGGDLATLPEYAGQEIGIEHQAENSFFNGSFAVNFAAGSKGNIGPVPPGPTASLGDRVWLDENEDGDQNCSNIAGFNESNKIPGDGTSTCAEPPVPNVPVQLTDCATGALLATDTTDADGFYLFTGLDQGVEYCVQFEAPDNCEWTVPNSGAMGSDLTDSDVGDTGFVNTGTLDVSIDRSWDAGLVCQEPLASLGDRVWLDEDEDGDQDCSDTTGLDESNQIPGDGGVTCAEPPVPDVPVQLTDCATGAVLGNDVTDANGFYLFTGLAQGGNYCVQFETPDNCEWTAQNASASDLTDSDVNSSGFVDTGILDVELDRSWDAGLVCRTASLGDRVWNDLDGDGDQDCVNTGGLGIGDQIPGDGGSFCNEPPEPGVLVTLTDCDTGAVIGTDTTDAGGFYLFTGLNFTTDYCLEFTEPADCVWTFQDSGDTDLTDSDVDTDGFANVGMLVADIDRSWDAGLLCGGPDIDIEKATNGVDADDPNAGDAPQVMPGDIVTWTYVITNTGGEPLTDIIVDDDQDVMLTCPGQPDTLFPTQSFTCTASGPADDLNSTGFTTVPGTCGSVPNTPLYENFGRVRANGSVTGEFVQDLDPSHYCNPQEPQIDIEKATNGVDADDPNAGDAPQVAEGGLVTWTYVITNIGNEPVTNLDVFDDQGVVLSCGSGIPAVLEPGDSFTCTASGIAEDLNDTSFTTVDGLCGRVPNTPLYENMGKVTGNGVNSGEPVQDDDPSHYCNPQEPDIDIEKATNGVDADNPNAGDAPQVMPGEPVTWTYVVTNVGNEPLVDVSVEDNLIGPITCPKTALAPGESMTCTQMGIADDLNTVTTTVPGLCGSFPRTPLYENMGKATGRGENTGEFVQDEDPSHYCNPQEPAIDIEKATNSVDADDPNAGDAPRIMPGDPVTWTYVVTNTGNTTLINVVVDDDQIGEINCPKTTLKPMESMICSKSGVAEDLLTTGFMVVPGLCGGFPRTPLYENMGIATGETTRGGFVEDDDPSHYCNPQEPSIKLEKLTNGFDADSRNESSTSLGDPTVPTAAVGSTITWRYVVSNTGNTVLDPIAVIDDAGTPGNDSDDYCTPGAGCANEIIVCEASLLKPGETTNCTAEGPAEELTVFTPVVAGTCSGRPTDLYENMAVAFGLPPTGGRVSDDDPSHYCNPGVCELDVNKTCLVIPPPQPPTGDGTCQKPIDILLLEYAGSKTITGVTWYAGEFGSADVIRSATADEVAALNAGQVVNFNGFEANNSPNDVEIVTTFADGSSTTSQFHLSCSDPDMDGPEDCGSVIGDGKSNALPASSNIWTFRGTRTPTGEGIVCPLPPADPMFPTQTACEFTPPQSAASCSDIKNLTALTMIWNGPDGVNVVSELGEVFNGVNNGDVITFGVDGDTDLTISGAISGVSTFHVSCSDEDMNGPEDCGKLQGNAKNNDDPDFINDWKFEGMTGEKGVIDCAVVEGRSGAEVRYGIEVANLNSEAVTVMISDPLLGIDQTETIAGGDTFQLQTDPALIVPDGSDVFTNVVTVSGRTEFGVSCDASASSTLTRNPPPPPPVSCSDIKDITELSMVWDGANGVDITTATGQFFPNVQNGNQITFNTVGVGNDVVLTLSGAVNGTSEFHISCSDEAMNGSEDCGSNQGNGKSDEAGLINDFLFDGMFGENGSFQCGLPNTGVVDPETPPHAGNVTGAATLDLSDNRIKWALTNTGTQDVFVVEAVVTWPAQHGQVKKMKLAGDFAKDIFDSTSPTTVPDEKAFESDPNKRKLQAGDTKNFEVEFTEDFKTNTEADYTLTITFDNGQTVSFP